MSVETKDLEVEVFIDALGWFVVNLKGEHIKSVLKIKYKKGEGVLAAAEDLQAFLFHYPEMMASILEEVYNIAKENGLDDDDEIDITEVG